MRHLVKKVKKLGKNNDQRRKLLRSVASSVIVHERIETTDRYLRAVAVDTHTLADVLDSLVPEGK